MCRMFNVAPSGYYAWLKTLISDYDQENKRLLCLIKHSYNQSHGDYGSPRIFLDLLESEET